MWSCHTGFYIPNVLRRLLCPISKNDGCAAMPEFLESAIAIGPFCKLPEPYGSDGRCGTEKIRRTQKKLWMAGFCRRQKSRRLPAFLTIFPDCRQRYAPFFLGHLKYRLWCSYSLSYLTSVPCCSYPVRPEAEAGKACFPGAWDQAVRAFFAYGVSFPADEIHLPLKDYIFEILSSFQACDLGQ